MSGRELRKESDKLYLPSALRKEDAAENASLQDGAMGDLGGQVGPRY